MPKKKAFGYIRVSGLGQVDRDGPVRQKEAILDYAKAHDIHVVQFFDEKGVSGTLADRPAWQAMMAELLSDGVQLVLVERLDRIARDLMVQETLLGDLRKHGFELISTCEPDLCGDDPTRKLLRQIMGAIAEWDRTMIVAKLRAARIRKRKAQGWCEGRKRFGQTDEERVTIARIKALRSEGVPLLAIAATLNKEKRRPQSAKRWYASSVLGILKRK